MFISRYVCLFMIYSFLGWIYETVFCIIKSGKWENRGFLYGPVVPIYGTGAMVMSIIVYFTDENGIVLSLGSVYAISVFGSAVLEYVTSWALEKTFHALWWDYSDFPLNIHGRISLFTSLGFGIAGLLIVYFILPFLEGVIGIIHPEIVELLSLCLMFVFSVDVTLTVTALYHFDQLVIRTDDSINQSMTLFVDDIAQKTNRIKQGIITRSVTVNDQINIMSGFARKAVHRVLVFKDNNKKIEAAKNRILAVIKKCVGRDGSELIQKR